MTWACLAWKKAKSRCCFSSTLWPSKWGCESSQNYKNIKSNHWYLNAHEFQNYMYQLQAYIFIKVGSPTLIFICIITYYLPFSFLNLDGRFENGLRNKFLPQNVISHSHSYPQPKPDISAELQILNLNSGQTQNRCSKCQNQKSQ